jgi:hypothetical protein
MLIKNSITIFLLAFTLSCHSEKESSTDSGNNTIASAKESSRESKYLRWVDDIEFDPVVDDDGFKVCYGDNRIIQYFNNSRGVEYEREKIAIDKAFQEHYDVSKAAKESGLIRIRFIVNCQGETGRFRVLSMDEEYNEKQFDASITEQLLEITKSLEGWKPKVDRGRQVDYYQYLIFKIRNGEIVKILP